jgi:class 3 adenylate cyclase/pimeloyl-ACP methyl ester carboxylesterase
VEPQIQYTRTADGASVAYYSMGEGPALVLVSPVLYSHLEYSVTVHEFHRVGKGLGRHNTIVRYDPRGVGLSDRFARDFSLEARTTDIEAVVDALALERFSLLGIAHGAHAAVSYAVRHPDKLTHMILSNPYAHGSQFRQLTRRFDSFRDIAEEDWEGYTLMMSNVNTGFRDPERAQLLAKQMRASTTPEVLREMTQAFAETDISSLLPLVRTPTLVLSHDGTMVLPEWAQEVAAAIPGAKLRKMGPREKDWWTDKETFAVEEFLGIVSDSPVATSDRDLRTVLFTDLVGHTEMMSRLGDDRGRDVLREHERITREVLKANGGTEVKTMGDGFMASFGSVTKAVECAIALQKAFAERGNPDVGARRPFSRDDVAVSDRGTTAEQPLDQGHALPQTPPSTPNSPLSTVEPLSVRVGLNAGEPIEEDGDLFGATVILASRIAAKANGGEILVADTVRGLCAGKGFLFSDRGEFVAKGIEEPVRVYEVSWRE